MIENTILKLLSENKRVADLLAKYETEPAVFYQDAANDMDPGWNGAAMYPRIDYSIEWTYNADRKRDGRLYVNIWCLNESETQPEDIAFFLKDDLSNIFMTDDGVAYCSIWDRMDPFDGEGKEPKTYGITISFDVLAFPAQQHGTPDPVECVQRALKERHESLQILEYDCLPPTFTASDRAPVVYVREISSANAPLKLFGASFLDCTLKVHIIAPDPNVRRELIQAIVHEISYEHRLIMNDASPFLLDFGGIQADNEADPLKGGQIAITGRYGMMIPDDGYRPMNKIIINQEE